MRILHIYSDWKWTGPAEPVLQACRGLQDRGHDVLLAYRVQQQEDDESVGLKVAEMAINGTEQFTLDRYLHPAGTIHDVIQLTRFVKNEEFDIIHVHLCHDHVLAGLCMRFLGRRRPPVVRTLHRRTVLKPTIGYRVQLRWLTDGYLAFTDAFREEYVRRFGISAERTAVMPMTVNLDRFSPNRSYRDMRKEFGISANAPVIGIVGRFQKYRRMEVFLEAARQVIREEPETRFLVIGRSGQIQETVVEPAERIGIKDQVILAGYRIDDYVDTLACLDIFTLLMPGFDGTARAVREALALGKPCVVSDFGMLSDIVIDGKTGLVVPDGDAKWLALAWLNLIRDRDRRQTLGQGAHEDAKARFNIDSVAPCLENFYERILAMR